MPRSRERFEQPVLQAGPAAPVDWSISRETVAYPEALARMQARVAALGAGKAREMVWLLAHQPLYTAGTSADSKDLLDKNRFPVYKTGRGGKYTYHGPGQRIAYVMLDLSRRGRDVRAYVWHLEEWLIRTLARLGIEGRRDEQRIGVWVGPEPAQKIAAIGVRVTRWVTWHGVSLNVDPDLSHYGGIVPCGIGDLGVTSLAALGQSMPMAKIDTVLRAEFEKLFGSTVDTAPCTVDHN